MAQPSTPPSGRAALVTLGGLALRGSDFVRAKPLALLSYLVLEGAKDREHLAELFWPIAARPLASLSVELSRLRARVGGALRTDDGRVSVDVDCDVRAFLAALDAGDHARAVELYGGPFLGGVRLRDVSADLTEWMYDTREFLAGRLCDALIAVGERQAAAGAFAAAADAAREAYARQPTGALEPEQLQRIHDLLVAHEHPWTTRVEAEARDLDLPLAPNPAAARARLRAAAADAELPSFATGFVGRSDEIESVLELLRGGARLVSIVGLAGVGKSRLAVEVVRRARNEALFPDGMHLAWLVALTDASEVPGSLAAALGVELKEDDAQERIAGEIGERRCLLYLDNVEHVIGSATLLSDLLRRCPELTILVSSRERLNLAEEWVVWLEGLSFTPAPGAERGDEHTVTEAARLFLQRARRSDVRFAPSAADLRAIDAICERVEGSPLAIELAASWTRTMPCDAIAEQLEHDPDLLRTPLRDVPERHRSIEAAFEYSWRLLSDEEGRVLRELAVFRGGFTQAAAREVVGAGLSTLAALVDKALLSLHEGGRFGRHPLLYEFTRRRFEVHARAEDLRQVHAAYYVDLVQRQAGGLGREGDAPTRLDAERANILLAWKHLLERGRTEALGDFAPALHAYFDFSGRTREGVELFGSACARLADAGGDRELRAALQQYRAQLLYRLGRFGDALDAAERSHALAEDAARRCAALIVKGTVCRVTRDFDAARNAYEEALELAADGALQARLLTNLAALEAAAGVDNLERAARLYERSLELKRAEGDAASLARTLYNYANLLRRRGDDEGAEAAARECLARCEEADYRPLIPYVQNSLGRIEGARGEAESALERFRHALRTALEIGDRYVTGSVLLSVAEVLLPARPEPAIRLLSSARTLLAQLGVPGDDDEDFRELVAAARAALPEPRFAAAWRDGEALAPDEAAALAFTTRI